MGEHDVRNVGVAGSNPVPSTNPRLACTDALLMCAADKSLQ